MPCSIVAPPRAVFLHTGWRTGGTWIWSRFRALPSARCYYEPLHERLAGPAASLTRDPASLWGTGHPTLSEPYFAEYSPLIDPNSGAVRHVCPETEAGPFFEDLASDRAPCPAFGRYVQSLIDDAITHRARGVFKFCRTLGRIGSFRRQFSTAYHVAVLRNPFSQFASAERQAALHDHPYFLCAPLALLAAQPDHPIVATCVAHLGAAPPAVPPGEAPAVTRERCAAALRTMTPEARYRAFVAFWAAACLSLPSDIDILTYDMLLLSDAYRRRAESLFAAETGLPVSLAAPREGPAPVVPGLSPAAVWRAHHDAQSCLAAVAGVDWLSRPALAQAGALLTQADILGTDRTRLLGVQRAADLAAIETRRDDAGSLARARWRAERAEQEVAWLRASRSWTLTAPIRWLGAAARSFVRTRAPVRPSREWRPGVRLPVSQTGLM